MRRLPTLLAIASLVLASVGIASAATFSLSAMHLGAAAVSTPVMFPVSVTIANKVGGTAGKPEAGDLITVVFSKLVNEPSVCSGWANTRTSQSTNLNWGITPGSGGTDDTFSLLSAPANPCAVSGMHLGAIDLGATGYVIGTAVLQFTTSTTSLSQSGGQTTMTVSLNGQKTGAGQPTAGQVINGGAATFTPDTAITDQNAHGVGSNLSQTSATTQF